MLIRFSDIQEHRLPGMNHGSGEMSARMYMDQECKIIPCKIHAGGSIGMHRHPTSDDINYILSGTGKAVCGGREELLFPGTCHRHPPNIQWLCGTAFHCSIAQGKISGLCQLIKFIVPDGSPDRIYQQSIGKPSGG